MMERAPLVDLEIAATKQTPQIRLCVTSGELSFSGKSYPENAIEFFKPVRSWLTAFVASGAPRAAVHFSLQYFSSSTSQVLYAILGQLSTLAKRGAEVRVTWDAPPANEMIADAGRGFVEDFPELRFELREQA